MKKPPILQRRKPKQARAQATVDSILEAAIQILQRHGADSLNTNRVAERAGVSIGTLYQYFPDKEAILLAIARRELQRPGAPSLQATLLEALTRALDTLLGRGAMPAGRRRGVLRAGLREEVKLRTERLAVKLECYATAWLAPMPVAVPAWSPRRPRA